MNFLQKKLWITWSKLRFLRLPVERRVRLEVTTDGRHITFLLVSLYEAGYGVQVFGSQFVFRELICLRKSAPMPFMYGGKERECGISISDKPGFNHRGHSEHGEVKRLQLDYDYFSGLNKGWVSHGGTANTEVGGDKQFNHGEHNQAAGRPLGRLPQAAPRGETSGSERVKEHGGLVCSGTGLRLAGQASASEPDSLTSKLAHAPVSESLIRSADGPTSSPATSHSPLVTAPEALRAPYFMHPSVYHRGLHKKRLAESSKHVPCSATALDSRIRIFFQPWTSPPAALDSIYAFPNTLDARLWTLDLAFGRRSPSPSRRRQQKVLSVTEEIPLVWGLRHRWRVASGAEAARDEGRGSRAIRQISSRHQPLASGRWTLDCCRLSPRLHLLCQGPRLWTLASRLLFRSPCGRILRG
jgi:hypothetical protein